MPIIKRTVKLILFLLTVVRVSSAQNISPLLSALNQQVTVIKSFDSEDDSDILPIGKILKDKTLIGLGEGTHGTREFYLYKARLIKYLILHQNLKLVLFESNMSGLDLYNQYSLFSIYRTQEIFDLISWIKTYNQKRPEPEKVRIAGIDMHYTYFVINEMLKSRYFLTILNPEQKRLLMGLNKLWEKGDPKLSKKEKQPYLNLAHSIYSAIHTNGITDSNSIYQQQVRLFEQSILFLNLGDIAGNEIRDKFMAENVTWNLNRLAPHQKAVVWAHNGHITKDRWRGYAAMGTYLKKTYKNNYYAIALAFGEGYARLWDPKGNTSFHKALLPPLENNNSMEYVFKQVRYPNFFLDMKETALNPVIKSYISKRHEMRVLGATFVSAESQINLSIKLKDAFDGIVFFRNTSNAWDIQN
ncbi:MAG: erythromycin esterase family protein [Bacteroidota bacterium]